MSQKKEGFYTSKKEQGAYGAYFIGQNIIFFLVSSYVMLYYTDYQMISPAAVSILFFVAKVWDAVNDPLFGVIVDKSNLKKGKFKPWISLATMFLPAITIIIFLMPQNIDSTSKIIYASVTYIIWGMLYTVCDVPIFALVTAMTDNIQERAQIISIGRLAAAVAMIILSIAVMPVVVALGWVQAAIILSCGAFLVMLPINIFAKERFISEEKSGISLKTLFSCLIKNKYLLLFYASTIIVGSLNISMIVGNYTAIYLLGGEMMIPVMVLGLVGPMFITTPFVLFIIKKIDKFYVYIAGMLIFIVGSLAGYVAGYSNFTVFLIFLIIRGVGFSIQGVLASMFAADCMEYGHYKNGERTEGITFSLQTFSTKLYGAISSAVGGIILTLIKYDGALEAQNAVTNTGLWVSYTLIPAIGLALGMIPLIFYKLRDKDVQIMAKCNQNKITREEAEELLSRKY